MGLAVRQSRIRVGIGLSAGPFAVETIVHEFNDCESWSARWSASLFPECSGRIEFDPANHFDQTGRGASTFLP
jgi:hypothetical protein